jgi:cellulose synthase/poly-beta-1,6-N-acetylglucosamine synthase-like glycosyltransferase
MEKSDCNKIFITFIIPTIGRQTLIDTVESLYNLNTLNPSSDWYAIIIFDDCDDNRLIKDELYEQIIKIDIDNKIRIIQNDDNIGNQCKRNSAGLVRNIGIQSIDFLTEWIGFVDDDDTLSPDYITNLKREIEISSSIQVCIFRMIYENGYVLPSKYDRNILRGKVGISFALKYSLTKQYFFTNNPFEDFLYLKNLQNNGFKILISSYISYYVRCKYGNKNIEKKYLNEQYPKIFIN